MPLYENVVAETLNTGLIVETWGSPQEEPSCAAVHTVRSNFMVALGNEMFKYTKDHSKYAVSSDSSKEIVCFGDINRQSSQWKRGGGTVCFTEPRLYRLMRNGMTLA